MVHAHAQVLQGPCLGYGWGKKARLRGLVHPTWGASATLLLGVFSVQGGHATAISHLNSA